MDRRKRRLILDWKWFTSHSLFFIFIGWPKNSHSHENTERPNILLFVSDDMGWAGTSVPFWKKGMDNNRYFRTPYMEELEAAGWTFNLLSLSV